MKSSYLRSNSRQDLELERYFGKIKATFARKALITFLDLLYVLAINLPIFVIFAYYEPEKGILDAFHKLVERTQDIRAGRMLLFSLGVCFSLYIYFVFIPSKTQYQTFFSSFLGMRAVTIDDSLNWKGKLSQKKLFKANLLPVFAIPLLCTVFFYCAGITNNDDGYEKLIKGGFKNWRDFINENDANDAILPKASYGVFGIRMLIAFVFAMQIFHLFTVGASKRALNGFTKSNRILYVNVERALIVMSTEDKPKPNKENIEDMTIPGSETIYTEEEIRDEYELDISDKSIEEVKKEETIDFSRDIDMDNDEGLERLKKEQEEKLSEENTEEKK